MNVQFPHSLSCFISFFLADGCSMWNHSEPIWVSLRHLSPGIDAVAAQWSLKALEGHASWSPEGCELIHSDSSTSTMRCFLLSNYAVLQVKWSLVSLFCWSFTYWTTQIIYMYYICNLHFSGGAWISQPDTYVCKGPPPCGLCMHFIASPLPLHRHHHTYTAPQVL